MKMRPGMSRGFSLMEVLIAMGIFAVGFIAVASVFPVGATLQRQAMDAIMSTQHQRNAKAIVRGRGLNENELTDAGYGLTGTYDTDGHVYPMPNDATQPFLPYTGYAGPPNNWPLADRSFPTHVSDPLLRTYYWVPLIRDSDKTLGAYNWQVFVFVMRRGDNSTYDDRSIMPAIWANPNDPQQVPGVRSVQVDAGIGSSEFTFASGIYNDPSNSREFVYIQPGDYVLDNFGVIYRVSDASNSGFTVDGYIMPNISTGEEPTTIWFGPPATPGAASPTLNIFMLTQNGAVSGTGIIDLE